MDRILEAIDLMNRATDHERFYRMAVFPYIWDEFTNGTNAEDPEWGYHYDTKVALLLHAMEITGN